MTTKLPPYPGRGGLPLPEELHLPADDARTRPDPDAPDDYEPLPDGMQQEEHFYDAVTVAKVQFLGRPGVLVSGNTPVYYLDENGRQQTFRPDCYAAFGVDPIAIRRRNGYFIARVGKPPDFVLEIASVSTYRNDLGPKRDLYARLGIGEYWRFDATGGAFYPESLAGETLVDGEYHPLEVRRDDRGVIRGYSPTIGLELCWDQGHLRFYDTVGGVYLRNLAEAERDRQEAERDRREAEARAAATHRDLEAALEAERARVRQLEEELRRRQPGN
jgi:Uma2 family endonuclease